VTTFDPVLPEVDNNFGIIVPMAKQYKMKAEGAKVVARNPKNKAAQAKTEVTENTEVKTNAVIQACEAAKTKFKDVVIVGLTDNDMIDVIPSTPYYNHIVHLLNRGIFEILIHEKATIAARQTDETAVV